MSKMLFTFRWGKSIWVTDKQLEKILLQYYKKTEVDEILKQYVTKIDLASELVKYAELNYVEQEVDRLDTKIDTVENTLNDDIDELGNHVNENAVAIRKLETDVAKNKVDISDNKDAINTNKKLLDETVDELKKARLWNILGIWNSTTTYKIGDVVGDTETQLLYLSVKEPNLNHPLTDKEYWIQVSGVQQINLDDYYNKSQINDFLEQLKDYINQRDAALQTQIDNITSTILPTKANKSDVYTKTEIDTKLNTKAGLSSSNVFSAEQHFHGGFDVNTGSQWNVKSDSNNFIIKSNTTDFKKIMIANSKNETRNLLDVNDYFSLENKIDNLIKKKTIPFSQFSYVNGSEHSGYYNTTYNNNTGISGDIISVKLDTKNNSYSIQVGYSQAGSWLDLYIAGNRSFESNINNIIIYYI